MFTSWREHELASDQASFCEIKYEHVTFFFSSLLRAILPKLSGNAGGFDPIFLCVCSERPLIMYARGESSHYVFNRREHSLCMQWGGGGH